MNPFVDKKTLRDHLVALTEKLVSFPSHVHEPLKIFELIEFIKSYFEKDKININSHTFGGFPSLFISIQDTKHPDVLLSGHVDVVPSSTRYTAQQEGNLLFGSGAMDMKGGIACMLAVMRYFSHQKEPPSLGLMITSDEEIGGEHGTQTLLAKECYSAHFVVINEGREKYELVTREKGILILKFINRGEFAHSAYPWKAKNVLEELMEIVAKVKKLFPKPSNRWMTTASVTMVKGGREMNTIPGFAEALMNIRFIGGKKWSREAILEKIRKVVPPHIEIEEEIFGDAFCADSKNPHIQLLRKSAEEVKGAKINFGENHGASDARIFMQHNIPAAILGPVGQDHHTPNEAVEIESLVTHALVLKRFIENVASKQAAREKF